MAENVSAGRRTARTRLVVLRGMENRTTSQEAEMHRLWKQVEAEDSRQASTGKRQFLPPEEKSTRVTAALRNFESEIVRQAEQAFGHLTSEKRALLLDRIDDAVDAGDGRTAKQSEFLRSIKYKQTAEKALGDLMNRDKPSFINEMVERRKMDPLDRVAEWTDTDMPKYPGAQSEGPRDVVSDRREISPQRAADLNQAGIRRVGQDPDLTYRRYDNPERDTPFARQTNELPLRGMNRVADPMGFSVDRKENPTQARSLGFGDELMDAAHDPSVSGPEGAIGKRLKEEATARPTQFGSQSEMGKAGFQGLMSNRDVDTAVRMAQVKLAREVGIDPDTMKTVGWAELDREGRNLVYQDKDVRLAIDAERGRGRALSSQRMDNMSGTVERQSGPGRLPIMGDPTRDFNTRGDIPLADPLDTPGVPGTNNRVQEWASRLSEAPGGGGGGLKAVARRVIDLLDSGMSEQEVLPLFAYHNRTLRRAGSVSDAGGEDAELNRTITNQGRVRGPESQGLPQTAPPNFEPILGRVNPSGIDTNRDALAFQTLMSSLQDQSGLKGPYIDKRAYEGTPSFSNNAAGTPWLNMKRRDDPTIMQDPMSERYTSQWQRFLDLTNDEGRVDFNANEGQPSGPRFNTNYDDPAWDLNDPTPRPAMGIPADRGEYGQNFQRGLSPGARMPLVPDDMPTPPLIEPPNPNFNPNVPGVEGATSQGMPPQRLDPGAFQYPGPSLAAPRGPSPVGGGNFLENALSSITKLGNRAMPGIARGMDAFGLAGNVLDLGEMSEFSRYIEDQNAQGGMELPGAGRVRLDPGQLQGLSALQMAVPFLGSMAFDRRKFMDDPAYRQRYVDPSAIPALS